MNSDIVKRIKKARIDKGLTQQDLANYLGKTAAAISDLERNKVQVSAVDLISFSEILNKPIEYFFGTSLDNEEAEIVISLLRRMDSRDKDTLMEYLIATEEMMKIVDSIENNESELDEDKRRLLEDFYAQVVPYFSALNTMHDNTVSIKEKLEKTLGISKN